MGEPQEDEVWVGDVRQFAQLLPSGSVHCIVTSPPYWSLRDYGTARWEGGDAACDHVQHRQNLNVGFNERWGNSPGQKKQEQTRATQYRDRCGKCGAVRVDRQLGLEPTVGEFVANLVAVFRALRPALRDDGVVFCNLGDSYANDAKWGGVTGGKHAAGLHGGGGPGRGRTASGLPPKCLAMAPARFAIAMVEDGWILRNDIIWHKPNPMPESVTDRFTTSYEHVFFFTKRPTYWADMEAVKEPNSEGAVARFGKNPMLTPNTKYRDMAGTSLAAAAQRMPEWLPIGRNARDVWTLPTSGFAGSHYATFPPDLARKCIRAGCPPRVCARCGAPWVRLVEREAVPKEKRTGRGWLSGIAEQDNWESGTPTHSGLGNPDATLVTTLGWRPTCACGPDVGTRPGVTMDPFMGSGTTALVAVQENRDWIGADLDPRSAGWVAERLAGAQRRLPLDLAGAAAGG
ncbi:MAG TPA: site-specific DNA-methyltransferase [Thermomicrobiales bacterium]|nr:site-specific DNA-methyltransferase [Thermomicrobiales bacterium]